MSIYQLIIDRTRMPCGRAGDSVHHKGLQRRSPSRKHPRYIWWTPFYTELSLIDDPDNNVRSIDAPIAGAAEKTACPQQELFVAQAVL